MPLIPFYLPLILCTPSTPLSLTNDTIFWPPPCIHLSTHSSIPLTPILYIKVAKHLIWHQAMSNEFQALLQINIWTLIPLTGIQNLVGCKWVFCTKHLFDGFVDRHKACLVNKGFHKHAGINFFETFSPIVKPTTICIILSITVSHWWHLHKLDINNAFLHGDFHEIIYMSQPIDFVYFEYPNHVCHLHKAIYDLK